MSNLFTHSAQWYDAIYSKIADHDGAAAAIDRIVRGRSARERYSLLDVACGTGTFIEAIGRLGGYQCEGLDLDPGMLAVARQRLPEVPLHQSDMAEFDLGRRFDVLTCVGSSLPAVGTTTRLQQALKTFARHLEPDGVMFVEPFIPPDRWEVGRVTALFVDESDLKIARMCVSEREGGLAIMDFNYLIATSAGVEHVTERHELGLFSDDDYQAALDNAGLTAIYDPADLSGRGLYVAAHA